MSPPFPRHTDVLRDAVDLAGKHVLEVGCGTGVPAGSSVRARCRSGSTRNRANWPAHVSRPRRCRWSPAAASGSRSPPAIRLGAVLQQPASCADRCPMAGAGRVRPRPGHRRPSPGRRTTAAGRPVRAVAPLEDETEVRREAFRALHAAATLGLRMTTETFYNTDRRAGLADRPRPFPGANPARAAALARSSPSSSGCSPRWVARSRAAALSSSPCG